MAYGSKVDIALLMKKLYSKDGYLPLIEFARDLNYVPEIASKWVSENSNYFKIVNEENGNVLVLGLTPVTFCKKHASKANSCLCCDELHVCKFFALGDSCKFGTQCNFSHNFETVHNRSVLGKHHLQHLDELELKCLFKKLENRCDVTKPTICKYFNKGHCQKKDCTFLHICKHYLMNNCTFGKNCKISHNLDYRNIKILKMFGIEFSSISKALAQLKMLFLYNREDDKHASERQMKLKINTICLHNLSLKQCSFKDECRYYHKEMPYQWQFKLSTGNDNEWRDFNARWNEKIEEKYCSLENEFHIIDAQSKAKFQFDKMTCHIAKQEYLLYRLSTVSYKSDPRSHLATTWIWYWKDKHDIWNEYGSPSDSLINITNEDIEKNYLDNPEGTMVIQTNDNNKLEINFKQMFQKSNEREVIRRPKFISSEAAAELRQKPFKTIPKLKLDNATNNLPSNWEISADETEISSHYKISVVDETSQEYKTVSDQFNASAIKAYIIKIERIQNGNLWEYYNWKKTKMTKESGQDVKELNLFHGTERDSIDAICKQGFDVRLSGNRIGCRYGKGIYFARDATLADHYIVPVKEECKIILANILVGEFVVGPIACVRPPQKNPHEKGGKLYDSCVDDIKEPKLFVIFANEQTYPAYIITYMKSEQKLPEDSNSACI